MTQAELEKEIIRKIFFRVVLGDVLRAYCGSSRMGAYILGFCLLDYLASFKYHKDSNKDSNRKNYKGFVRNNYLESLGYPKIQKIRNKERFFYKTRCHLVHQYAWDEEQKPKIDNTIGVSNMDQKDKDKHKHLDLSINDNNQIIVHYNLEYFIADLVCVTWNFFEKMDEGNKENLIEKMESDKYRWYFLYDKEKEKVENKKYSKLFENEDLNNVYKLFDNNSPGFINKSCEEYDKIYESIEKIHNRK